MAYPRIEQYNEAFQNHTTFILDPELKAGKLAKNGFGIPKVISGGFALTYVIETSNKKYAVRCFHKEAPDLELRYDEISKKINSLKSDYFVNFEFIKEGIVVSGSRYPLVKMEWAQGETLGEFVETNYKDSSKLKNLQDSIVKLAKYIENQNIAHGDIQPGNLMVSNNGRTSKLIDYDGMFTESLKNKGSSELGHINFQHPQRKDINPFNSKLDRFSFIVLWLAIEALIKDSNIWNKTKSDMDSFIFNANDYHDPQNSTTFKLLSNYPTLKDFVESFASVCNIGVESVPSLSDFVTKNNHKVSISTGGTRITTSSLSEGNYFSQYPVLDAKSYSSCLKYVGDQVEVVGLITDVTKQFTKGGGRPYIFINFGDWRGQIFKISIWDEGLNAIDIEPDRSWIGKYVSVKGLMEPPFSRGSYTHLAITVSKNNQLSLITEDDYFRRLKAKKLSEKKEYGVPEPKPNNTKILNEITGDKQPSNPKATSRGSSAPGINTTSKRSTSKNRDILNDIKSVNSVSSESKPVKSPALTPTTPAIKPTPVTRPTPTPVTRPRSTRVHKSSNNTTGSDWSSLIVFAIIILFLVKACS